jgi:hypothetical protein
MQSLYGETDIIATLLMMLPTVAVTVTVPPVVKPVSPDTRPADTVARLVLLEVHVATSVTSVDPLQVIAEASSCTVEPILLLTEPLVGVSVIDSMHPTVTVTVAVPVIDGFWLEAAVTVAVPTATDVTRPVVEIVAADVGVAVQETEGLLSVLPSLLVPKTVICTVLLVVPVSMVGAAGPTASEDIVGFTKKPRQLMARANIASAAKAAARRSFCFVDDISCRDSLGACSA